MILGISQNAFENGPAIINKNSPDLKKCFIAKKYNSIGSITKGKIIYSFYRYANYRLLPEIKQRISSCIRLVQHRFVAAK